MRILVARYKTYMAKEGYTAAALWAFVFFIFSLYINNLAIQFSTSQASNPVDDIILSNTTALPVDNLFIWGTIVLVLMTVGLCFAHPKRIPFMCKAGALFFIIRSMFVSLTHLAPFAPHIANDFGTAVNNAFFGADLFFSGHTGLPFLAALVFWHDKLWRYLYLGLSVFFAGVVLLGHIHYSIDVASAFFITYGIYHIALWLFPRDHALFIEDELKADKSTYYL